MILTYLSFSQVLPKDSEEFKHLVEYVMNTHGTTYTMFELEVMEIFKVARHGEEERFKSFSLHNRQLIWKGSRTTNFSGILSQVGGRVWWLVGLDGCVLLCNYYWLLLTRLPLVNMYN